MEIQTIETASQFEAWLKEHDSFVGARVLTLMPLSKAEQEPNSRACLSRVGSSDPIGPIRFVSPVTCG